MANLALTGFKKSNSYIYIEKDPDANLTYALDWVDYLATGDSLSTATVTIGTIAGDATPLAFPTNAATDVSVAGTKVIFRVNGGTVDNIYPIEVKVVTADGDTDARHFRIVVKNKELV